MTDARAPFLKSIELDGLLSFRPESQATPLTALNVLIGPNASGKSNFIEAFELLRATPTDLAGAIRTGGGPAEWLWKGERQGSGSATAELTAVLARNGNLPELRYRLEFTETGQRVEIVDEALEETTSRKTDHGDVYFYYRFQRGHPAINTRIAPTHDQPGGSYVSRRLQRESLDPQQSVFSQRRDPDLYPEVTRVGQAFGRILTFREWSFGRSAQLRQPQAADLSPDLLLPDLRNLGLVLNNIEHGDRWSELNTHLRRFLPRFRHLTTRILGGHVQINLQEEGLRTPVPATRLSDGTIRFIALLAILLQPEVASLICLEEPELGLHPDAIALTAELLIEASTQTQLVVTTHSDALVSALTEKAESVLVCESLANGTTLRRLESEKLRFWLEKYRLGEIWRIGELGGNT
jgi:predicted ATPase